MTNGLKIIIYVLISGLLLGCAPPDEIYIEHQGLIDCFRLDREPVSAEDCSEDLGMGNLARPDQGNYHRKIDEAMSSNVLIDSMTQQRMAKLPVSDCLWTAGSQFGNGDRVALYWEAFHRLDSDEEVVDQVGLHSACRFDPPFERLSAFDEMVNIGINDQCFFKSGEVIFEIDEPVSFNKLKSTCDMDAYALNLLKYSKTADAFGQCQSYSEADLNLDHGNLVTMDDFLTGNWQGNNQVSSCAPIKTPGLITMMPDEDLMFSVGIGETTNNNEPTAAEQTLLYPQIMTVKDQRTIARPMQYIQNNTYNWQATVVITGDVGQQKWLENFSENIRVDEARVFRILDANQNNREYINLEGAELRLYDPDDGMPGVAGTCAAEDGEVFDINTCQIDVTPTYRVENLDDTSLASLSDPLIWEVELMEEHSDDLFLEFKLVSTYKTSEAAILGEPAAVDFGGILAGKSKDQLITVTNVGTGSYVIDQVGIDPNYGQAHAFSAARLDDPIMIPYFIYLEPTGNDNKYHVDFQDLSNLNTLVEINEFETHVSARPKYNEYTEIEVESEAVMLQGQMAYTASPNPTFDGSLRHEGRIYPFRYPVYQTWQLPYLLKPGEQRTIMVSSQAPYIGEFKGKVDVAGYPLHAPNARDTISVFLDSNGMTGPVVDMLPSSLSFPRRGAHELNVIVINTGDTGLIRGDVAVIDIDSQLHSGEAVNFEIDANTPPTNNLSPGSSELIRIKYEPGCFPIVPVDNYQRATLKIVTDIGSYSVPLAGDPLRSADTNPACQVGG